MGLKRPKVVNGRMVVPMTTTEDGIVLPVLSEFVVNGRVIQLVPDWQELPMSIITLDRATGIAIRVTSFHEDGAATCTRIHKTSYGEGKFLFLAESPSKPKGLSTKRLKPYYIDTHYVLFHNDIVAYIYGKVMGKVVYTQGKPVSEVVPHAKSNEQED